MIARLLASLFLTFAVVASASAPGEYELNDGSIHFSAPPDWNVIMQKTEGDPQVLAFQVRDPAEAGTEEATRVSVTTRKLDAGAAFQAFVNTALEKARQMSGYEQDPANTDPGSLRYFAKNGQTRYNYRENYYFKNGIGVQLRCVHPVLAATTKQWLADFDRGCEQIAKSLAQ